MDGGHFRSAGQVFFRRLDYRMSSEQTLSADPPPNYADTHPPNLLILGVQKSATTWLFHQLKAQSAIFGADPKELFFMNKADKYLQANAEAYRAKFPSSPNVRYYMEASATYFWCRDENSPIDDLQTLSSLNWKVPRTVKTYAAEDCRFIVIFRNPVARAISAYYHHYRRGRIPAHRSILIAGQQHGILDMGRYRYSLKQWLRLFPRERFHFINFDQVQNNPDAVLEGLSEFLAVDVARVALGDDTRNAGFDLKAIGRRIRVDIDQIEARLGSAAAQSLLDAGPPPEVHRDEVAVLRRWYQTHVNHLAGMTGWDLKHWHTTDLKALLEM